MLGVPNTGQHGSSRTGLQARMVPVPQKIKWPPSSFLTPLCTTSEFRKGCRREGVASCL